MLSVAIHKDIGEYEPKIVGKLTKRSLASIAAALGSAVAIGSWCYFALGVGYDGSMAAILTTSMGIWAAGFWRPMGMPPEEFVPLWLRRQLTDDRALYESACGRMALEGPSRPPCAKGHLRRGALKGIEAYSPSAGRVAAHAQGGAGAEGGRQ